MKKSLLLSMSLAMFLGVGVAVGAHQGQKAEMVKADAVATDFIYLDNGSWYEGNERYAAYFFTDAKNENPAISEWVDFTWDEDIFYNKVAIPTTVYENVILCRMNKAATENIWENRWNQTPNLDNHTGIYRPNSKEGTNVGGAWEYELTVGSTTTYMIPNGNSKVVRTVTATAGDAVSLKAYSDHQDPGTLNPETLPSNNMNLDKTLKVGGSVEISVTKNGWSTWASGYAPASVKLQDFCDALLKLDCSATDLSGLGWDELEGADKTAFNGATVTLGYDVTPAQFGNVVNEAATRYALLIAKGATPIEGVTVKTSGRAAASAHNYANTSVIVILIISSFAVTIGVGLYFLNKKKEK